jgi:hypothetical protein
MQEDFDGIVQEFMNDYGFNTFYTQRSGTYDASQSKMVTVDTVIPVRALVMDYTLQRNGLTSMPGTEIQAGDKEMFIQPPNKTDPNALPMTIDPTTDSVLLNGYQYKVVTSKEVNTTGNNSVLFNLLIRR